MAITGVAIIVAETRPPVANLGNFPELIEFNKGKNCLVALALTTNSPFEIMAGIESDVPVPLPLTKPPVAKKDATAENIDPKSKPPPTPLNKLPIVLERLLHKLESNPPSSLKPLLNILPKN